MSDGTFEFVMPSLGADMESARLVEFLVEQAAQVHRGDLFASVETDKGVVDVEIFEDGIVEEFLVAPGDEAAVGQPLARLRRTGEPAGQAGAGDARASAEAADARDAEVAAGTPARDVSPGAAAAFVGVSSTAPGHVRAVPRARQLASELGIDLATVAATGAGGVVTSEDVERAAGGIRSGGAAGVAATGPIAAGRDEGRMRAAIAAAMGRSKREIPHYYLAHTIDLEPALARLERFNENRPVEERILPVALLVRAVAEALREFPEFCGWYRDDAFVPSVAIHVGLAVALRDGGLVNPAIRDADRGTLGDLFVRIRDLTERARNGQLRGSEFTDGAITVTSLGDRGVHALFPVIHPPQVAIVGFGVVAVRPWVVAGAVVPRRLVDVSLAADHRVSDGHRGGRFLRRVERVLQKIDPASDGSQ
jgi:pyruvate dehydrogenase E2 component (dihydrolipoamide acetyltransferase)